VCVCVCVCFFTLCKELEIDGSNSGVRIYTKVRK